MRASLRKRNLTQQQAAELCGWTQAAISKHCLRDQPPRASALNWISLCLGVPSEELIGTEAAKKMHGLAVAEAATKYAMQHPGIVWFNQLRLSYRDRAKRDNIIVCVRLIWPEQFEMILAWLDRKPEGKG